MKLWFLVGVASAVTPVQKVIEMMQSMLAKGQADAAEEKKIYTTYSDWVHDQDRDTKLDIGDIKSQIEKQDAIRVKAESDADELGRQIDELEGELSGFQNDLAAANQLRAEENAEYQKVNQDYGESFDALSRAIVVMKNKNYNVDQPGEFLQMLVREAPRTAPFLASFLQQPQGKVYSYESQGGGIIELLTKLKKKFQDELNAVQTEEANRAHNHQLAKMDLDDEIHNCEDSVATKTAKRAEENATATDAKRQLGDARAELDTAEKYLQDLHTTFTLKSSNFEQNQQVRAEEIKAISTAIEIISSGKVSGSADKHLPALAQTAQTAKPASFLQLKAKTLSPSVIRQVSLFLQGKNKEFGNKSKVLGLAAFKVLAASQEGSGVKGPFDKVVDMIKNLVTRLEQEAAEEAEHKAFCNKELKDNKLVRNKKTSEVEALQAKKESLQAAISHLASEIAALEAAEAALIKAMGEATEQRSVEKKKNTATVKDAKEAQVALSQALGVLREFYDGQSFLQQVPEMKIYSGQQSAKGGVVGMLEVIQSDFARLEADTAATEQRAQAQYDVFMTDAKADVETKHKDAFDKKLLKDRKEHAEHLNDKDLASTNEELDAATDYFDKLKPQCLEVKVSYEERVAMREQEIKSLQDALDILNNSE